MTDLIDEAKRCLQCKNPQCMKGCPVSTPIPEIIKLFLENDIDLAGKKLFRNNPLSVVCSLICPHEKNCMGHCILNKKSAPVKFHEIEHYISSFFLDKSKFYTLENRKYNVGIIGAGPAGISLAIILSYKGFKVSLIDSKEKIGGVLRYGIPSFRLPKTILDKILNAMTQLGIKFRPNTLIGTSITLDDMFNDGYDAIFIGTGVWKPNRIHIPGESLGNAHFAIDYLKSPDSYILGNRVAIIGAGNVAMDVARTILRNTHAAVDIIFNRGENDVTCDRIELKMSLIDGAKMHYYLNTVQILEDGIIVEKVIMEENDGEITYRNDPDSRFKIDADSVIIAIGQGPLSNIVKSTKDLEATNRGLIATTNHGVTSKKGVFAGGDVVTGAKTVVEAVAYTKIVADEIEKYCHSLDK